jgi:type I restriction enzyme M protein
MLGLIVIPEGKICDYIDGKFRNDTPEEYVRQNIEKRLAGCGKMILRGLKCPNLSFRGRR